MTRWQQIIWLAVLASAASIAARADWDAEVDPVAYALSGYSAHLGYRTNDLRVDLGLYGAEVPEAWHGNKGWTERTRGVGTKLDCLGSDRGVFAGIEANYSHTKYTFRDTGQSLTRSAVTAGTRIGYRIVLRESRLYIAPWLGIDYNFGESGARIGGHVFDEKKIAFFPTIHLGWRF